MTFVGILAVLLFGVLLGTRFKVMVLFPATILVVGVIIAIVIPNPAYTAWNIVWAAALLQVGYLLGLFIWHLVVWRRTPRLPALRAIQNPPHPSLPSF
jgi:hypothetical protein